MDECHIVSRGTFADLIFEYHERTKHDVNVRRVGGGGGGNQNEVAMHAVEKHAIYNIHSIYYSPRPA